MINKRDHYVISVESRKGGVGKTTIALNLADYLKDKYEILLLDLDLSGTAAGDAMKSLLKSHTWKNSLNILSGEDKESLNLVDLFEEYMTGKSAPLVVWNAKSEAISGQELVFRSGKINIISSYLQRSSHNKKENRKRIYGPAVLFDEMHSEWFISMIRELVTGAVHKLAEMKSKKKLVVIIDNAPGYSGMEPALEEWLTTLGPDCGKFLFIGTMDTQDISACFGTIGEIVNLYKSKWDTSRKFLEWVEESNNPHSLKDLNDYEKSFFNMLAETAPAGTEIGRCVYPAVDKTSCVSCGQCFYRFKNPERGNLFYRNPSRYVALVLNKVPKYIDDGSYDYDFQEAGSGFLDITDQISRRKIPFKSELMTQFLLDRLRPSEASTNGLAVDRSTISGYVIDNGTWENIDFLNSKRRNKKKFKGITETALVVIHDELIMEIRKKVIRNIALTYLWDDEYLLSRAIVNSARPFVRLKYSERYTYQAEVRRINESRESALALSDRVWAFSPIVPTLIRNRIALSIICAADLTATHTSIFNEGKIFEFAHIMGIYAHSASMHTRTEEREFYETLLNGTVIKEICHDYVFKFMNLNEAARISKEFARLQLRFLDINKDFNLLVDCFKAAILLKDRTPTQITILKELLMGAVVNKSLTNQKARGLLRDGFNINPPESSRKEPRQDPVKAYLGLDNHKIFGKVFSSILSKEQWDI